MVKCDYCGKNIEKGTGKMFIKDSGKIINFCTKRCEKDMLVFGRKSREQKWTDVAHAEKAASKKS